MPVKKAFAFNLKDRVNLEHSSENGMVIGRAHYIDQLPSYLIRYTAANGVQMEAWWAESAIRGKIPVS